MLSCPCNYPQTLLALPLSLSTALPETGGVRFCWCEPGHPSCKNSWRLSERV